MTEPMNRYQLAKRIFNGAQDTLARAFLAGFLANSNQATEKLVEILSGTGSDFEAEENAFATGRVYELAARAAAIYERDVVTESEPIARRDAAQQKEQLTAELVANLFDMIQRLNIGGVPGFGTDPKPPDA